MEDPWAMFDAAALGIRGAIVKTAQAGEGNGGCTHGTGLQRDVDGAIGQPGFAPHRTRLPNSLHLRMGRGIRHFFGAVAGLGQDITRAIDDNCADGHLVTGGCCPGFFQGQIHEG